MRAIFQKRTIKGKNVEKEQKRAKYLKIWAKIYTILKKMKKGGR